MRAMIITAAGQADKLTPAEQPKPKITAPHDVLIRLKAAAINPIDLKIRSGVTPYELSYPLILGFDGAGIVEAVGSCVERFQVGDEVWFCDSSFSGGCYAEYTVVDEVLLAKKPSALSFVEAAAVPLAFITAWEALYDRAHLKAGDRVLIRAGAGGVGHLAVQIARQAGAKIGATVGNDANAQFVRALGAEQSFNYKDEKLQRHILDWCGEQGCDLVFDTVGGPGFEQCFPVTRYGGDLVTLIQPAADVAWGEARMRNLRVSQELMLTPAFRNMQPQMRAQSRILEQVAPCFQHGDYKVHVHKIYPLEDCARAHKDLEAGGHQGKLVLEID